MNELHGRVCFVTGSTHGIGFVTAQALAGMGATVIVHGRNPARVEEVRRMIQQRTGNPAVTGLAADFASLRSVRGLASAFLDQHQRLDVLINNAGSASRQYQTTTDGFEWHFGVNHLAPFLLTNLLLDTIKASAPARVIAVSSEAHKRNPVDLNDLNFARGYGNFRAYGRSKFANILFVMELARRLEGTGVTANALHPGFVNTNIFDAATGALRWLFLLMKPFALSPEEGAKTTIYLASSPEVAGVTGAYFAKCQRATASAALNPSLARDLWKKSEELAGGSAT